MPKKHSELLIDATKKGSQNMDICRDETVMKVTTTLQAMIMKNLFCHVWKLEPHPLHKKCRNFVAKTKCNCVSQHSTPHYIEHLMMVPFTTYFCCCCKNVRRKERHGCSTCSITAMKTNWVMNIKIFKLNENWH